MTVGDARRIRTMSNQPRDPPLQAPEGRKHPGRFEYVRLSLCILASQYDEARIGIDARLHRSASPRRSSTSLMQPPGAVRSRTSVEPHRHHDEQRVIAIRDPDDAGVEGLAKFQREAVAARRTENVLEVPDIEPREQLLALEFGRNLLPDVSGIHVLGSEDDLVCLERETDRVVPIGSHDPGTLEGTLEDTPVEGHHPPNPFGTTCR